MGGPRGALRNWFDRRWLITWACVCVLAVTMSAVLSRYDVSAAPLLGSCIASAAVMLWMGTRHQPSLVMPRPLRGIAQAVIGVHLGLSMNAATLANVASGWFVVAAVLLITVAVCLCAASVVARYTAMSLSTARIGLMPGGASVSIAISDDVGTDARLVAVMQYSRVYLVLASLPFVAHGLGDREAPHADPVLHQALPSAGAGIVVWLVCLAVTLPLIRLIRFPAGYLLVPLVLAMLFAALGPQDQAMIPDWLLALALGVIGVFVGLQFTVDSLKQAGRSLPIIVAAVTIIIGICAALGFVMAELLNKSLLDGYLATTPGGVNVVLGVTAGGDVDAGFVAAAQVLRILAMMLALPLLGAWHTRSLRL